MSTGLRQYHIDTATNMIMEYIANGAQKFSANTFRLLITNLRTFITDPLLKKHLRGLSIYATRRPRIQTIIKLFKMLRQSEEVGLNPTPGYLWNTVMMTKAQDIEAGEQKFANLSAKPENW